MKLSGSRADKYIQSPDAKSLGALIYGPDRGFVQERAKALCAKFVSDPSDAFNVTVLTADDLSSDTARLADEMAAMSLLGDARLIRLRLDHEKQGLAISKLIKSFDTHPDRCAAKLVIEAGDLSPRSHIRKAFDAAGNFSSIPCYAVNARDLGHIIKDRLRSVGEHGISIDSDALAAWTPLLEGDRALAGNEIEKIALYKGYGDQPDTRITIDDIHLLAAGGQAGNIDEIIYAACAGRLSEADDAFRRAMSGKMHAAVILRSLQRHLTRLHQAIAAMQGGQSASDAMRSLRPPVFAMRKRDFESQLRQWSLPALDKVLAQSLETEKRVKSAGAPVEALTGRLINAVAMISARRRR